MVTKNRYKILSYLFISFNAFIIILDTLQFLTEGKSAEWFLLHFIFNFGMAVPMVLACMFAKEKVIGIIWGIVMMGTAIMLSIVNKIGIIAPPIFLSFGFFAIIDLCNAYKKYGWYILYMIFCIGLGVLASYIHDLNMIAVFKTIGLYIICLPLGGAVISLKVSGFIEMILIGKEDETEKT